MDQNAFVSSHFSSATDRTKPLTEKVVNGSVTSRGHKQWCSFHNKSVNKKDLCRLLGTYCIHIAIYCFKFIDFFYNTMQSRLYNELRVQITWNKTTYNL